MDWLLDIHPNIIWIPEVRFFILLVGLWLCIGYILCSNRNDDDDIYRYRTRVSEYTGGSSPDLMIFIVSLAV